MKTLIFISLIVANSLLQSSEKEVKLFRGGEVADAQSSTIINWDYDQIKGSVDILLWNGNKSEWTTLASEVSANSESYTWNIPSDLSGDMFRLKVVNTSTKEVYAFSETYFSIDAGKRGKINQLEENIPLPNNEILVFPSPSNDAITLQSTHKIITAKVYDMSGTELFKVDSDYLNISSLVSGSYFIVVTTEHGSQTVKFVKL